MQNQASTTARMSAFGRAYHAEHDPHPVFRDTAARSMLSDMEYAMLQSYLLSGMDFFAPERKDTFDSDEEALLYLVNTHIAPTPLCRAAYCEKSLETAVRTGTEQYVILGAGLDTFAFRSKTFVSRHRVYEVDHPATQQDKLQRIKAAGWEIPGNLRFVPVDFSKDDLKQALESVGFDASKKTFYAWLGVSYYLDRDSVGHMLTALSEISADGSTLLFDYADEGLFDAKEKRVQNMIAMAKAGGEEMKSCFEQTDLEMMLGEHGFLAYEILTPMDIREQIIRPAESSIRAFEHIRYVQAVLKK